MRMLGLLVAVALFAGADVPDDETARELKKFQGTWALVEGKVDGKQIKAEHLEGSKIVWKGTLCTLKTPHQSDEEIRATVTRISPGKGELEWVRESGPHKGTKVVAIYEFVDPDNYKICFHPAGKSKPETFGSEDGSGHIFHTWKRVKK